VDLPNSLLSRFDLVFLILDKASIEADLALSRHVLHVHKYRKKPENELRPLDPESIKQYISAARALQPTVPKHLSNYIVEAYVSLRAQDGSGPAAQKSSHSQRNDQTAMTARQLLSILRLSQALARLRLANEVSAEDIEEAIRLTHASKASLFDDVAEKVQEDSISVIFSAIRDLSVQQGSERVNYSSAAAIIVRKGFTEKQLLDCIDEYEGLGVLSVNEDRTEIIML
jgi:DNA replication licensing factor MCM7